MSDSFDPQKMQLSERQVDCLTYIEQQFMLEGSVPTVDKISDVFGVSKATVRKWLKSDEFNYILNFKGITVRRASGVLSSNQLMIAEMLLNISDRRSKREKCEAAGITVQQLAAWKRDPQFNDYMQKRAEQLFKDSDDVAYLNVVKNMESGDLKAAQFYFEMSGKYQPSMRHDVNLDSFVAVLIEILQARVQDPQTLELIAGDIENLMSGRPVNLEPAHSIVRDIPEVIEVPEVKELERVFVDSSDKFSIKLDI